MVASVYILSKENFLSESLRKVFSEKGCGVNVVEKSNKIPKNTNYIVVINFNDAFSKDSDLSNLLSSPLVKTVVVNGVNDKGLKLLGHPTRQIFVDQIFPTRASLLSELQKESKGSHVFVPKEAWLSIVTLELLTEELLREIFSFPEDKRTLFGKLISFREVINILNPNALISINANATSRVPRQELAIIEPQLDIKSLDWGSIKSPSPVKQKKFKTPSIKIKTPKVKVPALKLNFNKRSGAAFLGILVFLLMTPYLMLAMATAASFVSFELFRNGRMTSARSFLSVSNVFAETSSSMLSRFIKLPFAPEANILAKGTNAAGRVLSIADTANVITEESLKTLSLELSSLYRDLSFISGDFKYRELPFANIFPEVKNLDEYRAYLLAAANLSEHLPSLLGFDTPKTYMVLLQNNMELRATGGFIGSFALITFSKGELIDDTIYDVYSADGQLKGYIAPPEPIFEHLGEASWTLRDSNWDPDFPVSAERAQWFLDKSLDRQVDGVVAINLEAAKEYLKVVEPVYLLNFNDTIDSKNMYEKVQYEVEENFFPGSRKKAQYLSALSDALIARLESATTEEYVKILEATLLKLDSRDIQISINNQSVASVLRDQKWDGSIDTSSCDEANCAHIFSGTVEANLGVNKANYFVERAVNVAITVEDGYIEQEVSLKLRNNAEGQDRIPQERYKTYTRAIAPLGSSLEGATLYSGSGKKALDVDIQNLDSRIEYGVLVDILPGEEKIVSFRFRTEKEINYSESGKLKYSWWKQSGTGEYPFNITVSTPNLTGITWTPPFRLTEEGKYGYNTNLSRDFKSELIFTKHGGM